MSLRVLIPTDIELAGEDFNDLRKKLLDNQARDLLFFDELISGYVIFEHTDTRPPHPLIHLNLAITQDSADESLLKYDEPHHSVAIDEFVLDDTHIVHDEPNCTIWKFEVNASHPRRKSANPLFSITAKLSDNTEVDVSSEDVLTLVSSVKLPDFEARTYRDLFSELHLDDVEVQNAQLNTNLIVEKPKQKKASTILYSASIEIPIIVSVVLKMKTTKPAGRNSILLATINLKSSEELVDFFDSTENYQIKIINLNVEFPGGLIVEFLPDSLKFPHTSNLNDVIDLTYKLVSTEIFDKEAIDAKHINIELVLQILKHDSETKSYTEVSNTITTTWVPFIDFFIIAPPINNSLKTSTNYSHAQSQPLLPSLGTNRKANNLSLLRPKNLPSTSSPSLHPLQRMSKRVASSTGSVTVNLTTSNNSALSGLRLTFKGKLCIKVGEIVTWKLQAINNSNNKLNLLLMVQNNIKTNPTFTTVNSNSSTQLVAGDSDTQPNSIIMSSLSVYSEYLNQKISAPGVLILDNDVGLGPLESNGVFETEIKLIGTARGIFNLEGIKIFDTTSGDGLDFGKLVEVFVI